jgi:hypothetical protein
MLLVVFDGNSDLKVEVSTLASFSVLLFLLVASAPLGMFLMDRKGRFLQAWLCSLFLLVKMPVSIPLTIIFGAQGPVLASIIGQVLFVIAPMVFYVASGRFSKF